VQSALLLHLAGIAASPGWSVLRGGFITHLCGFKDKEKRGFNIIQHFSLSLTQEKKGFAEEMKLDNIINFRYHNRHVN